MIRDVPVKAHVDYRSSSGGSEDVEWDVFCSGFSAISRSFSVFAADRELVSPPHVNRRVSGGVPQIEDQSAEGEVREVVCKGETVRPRARPCLHGLETIAGGDAARFEPGAEIRALWAASRPQPVDILPYHGLGVRRS